MRTPEDIFPEYYIIRVNEFNKVATTPLEEWISYLKDGQIDENTTAPGLAEARQKLQYLKMTKEQRQDFDHYIDAVMSQNDVIDTAKMEGWEEGHAEGRAKGLAEGRTEQNLETARNLKKLGVSAEIIMKATGLSAEEIESL